MLRTVWLKAAGGNSADTPPGRVGADTDAVLQEYGYSAAEIGKLRADGVV